MLYFVARYLGITNGCHMRWNFFGTAHDKGTTLNLCPYSSPTIHAEYSLLILLAFKTYLNVPACLLGLL
jgi:hypothetical protein